MNTLLITVDALRADHLGQYGYERDTMPVLDRLCEEGVVFTGAFANGPYTRISIPALHSSVRLAHVDLDSVPTISGELRAAGVTTACVGTNTGFKSAEGELYFGEYVSLGRDEYHETAKRQKPLHVRLEDSAVRTLDSALEPYPRLHELGETVFELVPDALTGSGFRHLGYTSAATVTDTTVDWLADHTDEEFFLWVHYMEGHRPYGVHDDDPEYTTAASHEHIRSLMKKAGTRPEEVTASDHERLVDLYDSDLRYCSRHLERLFDRLERLGLWEETNVVFTSDHGEEFADHGQYFHRNLPYDELLHVPLVVRSPDDRSGRVPGQRELVDVAPTILEFHDVSPPDRFEGRNLFAGEPRDVVATGGQIQTGPVVGGRWDETKYIYTDDGEYLYDLSVDPREETNRATERPQMCEAFRGSIPDRYFSDETEEQLREPDDAVDRDQLEALGYLEIDE